MKRRDLPVVMLEAKLASRETVHTGFRLCRHSPDVVFWKRGSIAGYFKYMLLIVTLYLPVEKYGASPGHMDRYMPPFRLRCVRDAGSEPRNISDGV